MVQEIGRAVGANLVFALLLLPSLLESLGRQVNLEGYVEFRGTTPVSIQILNAEVLEDRE